jgi:hypothetical protein
MPSNPIFVACPYTLFPIDDYKAVFSNVRKAFPGVKFVFADEEITNMHIMEKIKNYILDSEFSLFDVTGWNANVTLELGMAVGLRKEYYILLNTDGNTDAPADIRGLDRVQYTSNTELEAKLTVLLQQKLGPVQPDTEASFENLKGRIATCLEANTSGLSSSAIADAIGERKELVQPIVYAMLGADEIKSTGAKKGKKYYPNNIDLRRVARN